jgi:hypothetical protein
MSRNQYSPTMVRKVAAAVEAARAFHAEAALHQMVALTAGLAEAVAKEPGGAQALVKGFATLRMAAERLVGRAARTGPAALALPAPSVIQVISGVPGPNDPDGGYGV